MRPRVLLADDHVAVLKATTALWSHSSREHWKNVPKSYVKAHVTPATQATLVRQPYVSPLTKSSNIIWKHSCAGFVDGLRDKCQFHLNRRGWDA